MGESPTERRPSRVFFPPDLSTPGTLVSPAEARFFREHGFFVKHGLLGRDAMAAAIERTWEHLLEVVPQDTSSGWRLDPRDPSTWQNPRWAPMPPHPASGEYQGRAPVEYYGGVVKLHFPGRDELLLESFANHARVRDVVQALLGGEIRPTRFFRGVYPTFPTRESPDDAAELARRTLAPHLDRVCQQVNACAYLSDVAPRSGGFTVYPGSHLRLFSEHRYEANWSPLPSHDSTMREVAATIEPVEITASGGSVVFWHGRLLHSGGVHFGRDIRWAAFADYTHDRPTLTAEEHRARGEYEWFKDVQRFREDFEATPNPWRHWAIDEPARP